MACDQPTYRATFTIQLRTILTIYLAFNAYFYLTTFASTPKGVDRSGFAASTPKGVDRSGFAASTPKGVDRSGFAASTPKGVDRTFYHTMCANSGIVCNIGKYFLWKFKHRLKTPLKYYLRT